MKKLVIILVILTSAIIIAGCQSEPTQDEIINQGRIVFKDKCVACHAINGQGGNRGPDLSDTGGRHDEAWFKKWLENPYSVKPDSTMPQVSLSASEIDNLKVFLGSLK